MSSISDADIAFAIDLLSDLGPITNRKMFGGICLYYDGTVFSLVSSDGTIYLKTKGSLANALADDGGTQFHNMPYWSLPDQAREDPTLACELGRRALSDLRD
ncbi:MAG: TfoX/Sxy family protein [Loktanella sp.]|nr:TfoX/Sxy family protein [Loktanella sp.]MDO7608229.1 TfoX/Sxy family protein [Loktanella sp.]MDO7622198.1 TfoX/Sxy family protein [Loktanella sp.]MDO7626504.1 TfoX/Sxy family protein [Loktanella sp.]MDO7664152.1 TfoX/Sxy family protein [Loktanella sp.]